MKLAVGQRPSRGKRIGAVPAMSWEDHETMVSVDFRPDWNDAQAQPKTARMSLFEILTKVVGPIAALVVASLQQQNRVVFWVAIAFALTASIAGFYPFLQQQAAIRLHERRRRQIIRQRYPEFRKLLIRFGTFVQNQSSDTLHQVCRSGICGNNDTEMKKFNTAPADLFSTWWAHLLARCDGAVGDVPSFIQIVAEFNSLLMNYGNCCVRPVFESFPAELRPKLSDHGKADLEQFRSRFSGFEDRYQEFVQELDAALGTAPQLSRYFYIPKPIV